MIKKRVAIFASGTGSNAVNLINFFNGSDDIDVSFVLSNNAQAKVLDSASSLGVKTYCFSNDEVNDGSMLVSLCEENNVDWIVLAGYLRLIPSDLIKSFEGKMINLHPSLLPNYGGKGMYGSNVHKAVIANGEKESGITIHYVNEAFDDGNIIAQFHCQLDKNDDVSSLEGKIRKLEQAYLPIVVQNTILN
jgi:phosphoribosylglycinamide formyltransferase-1